MIRSEIRAEKITDFGLKWGKGFRKHAAHPPNFSGSNPPNFQSVLGVTKSRALYQVFLVESVETGKSLRD